MPRSVPAPASPTKSTDTTSTTSADQLRKLAAISEFINRQPALRWSPPGEPKQRYNSGVGRQFSEEEGLQFVLAARHDHRDEPAIQAALDVYLRSIE